MRGRACGAVLVLCVVLPAACSGASKPKVTRSSLSSSDTSTDSSGSSGSSGATTTTLPARLPADLCAAFVADRQRRAANATVAVATLTSDALRARFDAANQAVQAMIAAATGDLRPALQAQLAAQQPGQAAVEAAWGDTGEALAAQAAAAGFHDISSYVERDGVTLPDGTKVTLASVARLVERNLGRLAVGCDDQALGVRPDEHDPAPPAGSIIFSGGGTATQLPTLDLVGSDGADRQQLLAPGSEGRYGAVVGQDGAVAFVAADKTGTGTLKVATSLDSLTDERDVGLPASCPAWAPDRHLLVASILDEVARRGVYVIDASDKATTIPLPFPALDVGCAVFAGGDALLVSRLIFGGGVELWRVPLPGASTEASAATKVFGRGDCLGFVGGASPDGTSAALSLSCVDVRDSGVHLIDLATGHDDHLVAAIALSPRYSPDGRWLVFSSCPLGGDTAADLRVTVMRDDGVGSRPIVDDQSTFPSWLPPGVGSGAPKT